MTGLIQVSPGSRVPGSARPKRKTMPFSYWEMILKPNLAAVLSPAGAGLAGTGGAADVIAGVRISLGIRFYCRTPGNQVWTPRGGHAVNDGIYKDNSIHNGQISRATITLELIAAEEIRRDLVLDI